MFSLSSQNLSINTVLLSAVFTKHPLSFFLLRHYSSKPLLWWLCGIKLCKGSPIYLVGESLIVRHLDNVFPPPNNSLLNAIEYKPLQDTQSRSLIYSAKLPCGNTDLAAPYQQSTDAYISCILATCNIYFYLLTRPLKVYNSVEWHFTVYLYSCSFVPPQQRFPGSS